VHLIHNERTKLLATALNNTAVATLVTALVAPAVSFLYNTPNATAGRWWVLIGAVWFAAGLGLHVLAQIVLGRLKP